MEVQMNTYSHAPAGIQSPAYQSVTTRRWPQTLAALVLVLSISLGVTADASAKALRKGDHNRNVVTLQQLLHITADGTFGDGTVRALKKFQRAHHLTADGLAGTQTVASLRRANRKAHPRAGSTWSGPRVAQMQRALGIGADGKFGPGTQRAVKAFQRSHGLTADGVVGQGTWAALGLHSFAKPALRRKPKPAALVPSTGGASGKVARMIAAGNRIATTPYIWGGGHGSFRAAGYDCSGSVSYVLHGAGLLRTPLDSTGFESYGAAGPGRHVTIYANGGHVFMTINGRRFDTSGASQGGSRWSNSSRSGSGYVVRHPRGL